MAPGTMSERIASVAGLRRASDEGKLRLMAESPITVRPAVRAASGRLVTILLPWLALLALWYAVRASGLVSAALVPTPGEVVTRFWNLLWQGTLAMDILMSTQRVVIGVALGIALAVPVGFVLGWYRQVRSFIDPLINFFRALPPIALIPLVIVYFGIGEPAKVVILFYASFFAGVIVMYEGIAQISPIFVRVARTLGASDGEIFRKVIVPMAVPHVLTALRVALGVAWATLVASELIAAQQGLGAVIQDAAAFFQLDIIYVGIICIGFIALAMDLALRAVTRRLVSWQERIAA
jgi:NitT/TauT family transport system permease protein